MLLPRCEADSKTYPVATQKKSDGAHPEERHALKVVSDLA
jgi:hypothetical protein